MLNLPAPGLQEDKQILRQTILFTEKCKYRMYLELGCWGETTGSLPSCSDFCLKKTRKHCGAQSHGISSVNSVNLGLVMVEESYNLIPF